MQNIHYFFICGEIIGWFLFYKRPATPANSCPCSRSFFIFLSGTQDGSRYGMRFLMPYQASRNPFGSVCTQAPDYLKLLSQLWKERGFLAAFSLQPCGAFCKQAPFQVQISVPLICPSQQNIIRFPNEWYNSYTYLLCFPWSLYHFWKECHHQKQQCFSENRFIFVIINNFYIVFLCLLHKTHLFFSIAYPSVDLYSFIFQHLFPPNHWCSEAMCFCRIRKDVPF